MGRRKERLTVTIDAGLVEAGLRAVKTGRAESLSGWINDALAEREAKERRLRDMAEAIAAYEGELGVMSEEEIVAQRRADAATAVVVRGRRSGRTSARGRGRRRPKAA